jgi:hypothetical protein
VRGPALSRLRCRVGSLNTTPSSQDQSKEPKQKIRLLTAQINFRHRHIALERVGQRSGTDVADSVACHNKRISHNQHTSQEMNMLTAQIKFRQRRLALERIGQRFDAFVTDVVSCDANHGAIKRL